MTHDRISNSLVSANGTDLYTHAYYNYTFLEIIDETNLS